MQKTSISVFYKLIGCDCCMSLSHEFTLWVVITLCKVLKPEPNRTVRPEKPQTTHLAVLLTLRTALCEKCMKPLEPWSNRTVLRTVASFRGSHGSIFSLYLARKLISVHKEFEYKKYKNKLREGKRKQRAGLTAQAKLFKKKKKIHLPIADDAAPSFLFLHCFFFHFSWSPAFSLMVRFDIAENWNWKTL